MSQIDSASVVGMCRPQDWSVENHNPTFSIRAMGVNTTAVAKRSRLEFAAPTESAPGSASWQKLDVICRRSTLEMTADRAKLSPHVSC